MVNLSAKTLAMVIAAMKDLRETKGSTSREILRYITSAYNIPIECARRQMQTALKRGVAYGILRKSAGHYSLPIDTYAKCEEVATQELGLLDFCSRRRHRATKKKSKRTPSCKGACKCKPKRGRLKKGLRKGHKRNSKKCNCKKGGGRGGCRRCKLSKSPTPKSHGYSSKEKTEGLENDKFNVTQDSSSYSSASSI